MNKFIVLLIMGLMPLAHAQKLWQRNDQLVCVLTTTNVDDVQRNLKQKYGKDCDYLRDSTRVILGSLFRCPDEKIYSYFRSKENCEMFFSEAKKDLEKFVPAGTLHPKLWVQTFGTCMETAGQAQVIKMGLENLNRFCFCVAGKTKVKMNNDIFQACSKNI